MINYKGYDVDVGATIGRPFHKTMLLSSPPAGRISPATPSQIQLAASPQIQLAAPSRI